MTGPGRGCGWMATVSSRAARIVPSFSIPAIRTLSGCSARTVLGLWPVSRHVNTPKNNDATLLDRLTDPVEVTWLDSA